MNPKFFTLENIFNMDLARYKDICMEIVGNSVKELNIERNIKDVEKVHIQYIYPLKMLCNLIGWTVEAKSEKNNLQPNSIK